MNREPGVAIPSAPLPFQAVHLAFSFLQWIAIWRFDLSPHTLIHARLVLRLDIRILRERPFERSHDELASDLGLASTHTQQQVGR